MTLSFSFHFCFNMFWSSLLELECSLKNWNFSLGISYHNLLNTLEKENPFLIQKFLFAVLITTFLSKRQLFPSVTVFKPVHHRASYPSLIYFSLLFRFPFFVKLLYLHSLVSNICWIRKRFLASFAIISHRYSYHYFSYFILTFLEYVSILISWLTLHFHHLNSRL